MPKLLTPDYHERRQRALASMADLERGSRTRCAFDIGLAPSLVSTVLTGTYENAQMLGRIEAWLAGRD